MAELTVMTWNVQNLLSVGHADALDTIEEYAAKLAALAAVIDVVEAVGHQAHPRVKPATCTVTLESLSVGPLRAVFRRT